MYDNIEVRRETVKRTCPNCGKEKALEWTAGKTDNSMQEYMCRSCRTYTRIYGMTEEDQLTIAEEAFD